MNIELSPEYRARNAVSEAFVYTAGLLAVASEISDPSTSTGVVGAGLTFISMGTFARCVDHLKETWVGDAVQSVEIYFDGRRAQKLIERRTRLEDISDAEQASVIALGKLDHTRVA